MENFEILDWDSQFFGIKIARLSSQLKAEHFQMIAAKLASHQVQLAYFNSTFSVPQNEYFEGYLLDKRISLINRLKNSRIWDPRIKFYDKKFLSADMNKLSRRVAESSRFFYDTRIPNSKVYEMYEIWLKKSIKKEMATETIIFEEDNHIRGFATIKALDNRKALIPLFAVDRKHEGKGISFLIMQAIETYLLQNNFEYLESETQAYNFKALKVYERFGIKCEQSHQIFHLWRKGDAVSPKSAV